MNSELISRPVSGEVCPVCACPTELRAPEPQKRVPFATHACPKCQFVFAVPENDSSSPELYDPDWSKTEIHPTYVFADGRYTVNNAWKLHRLLDRLEPFRKLNRMLDVGCSAAFFLKLAKDRGWDVQGVEVADWAVKF